MNDISDLASLNFEDLAQADLFDLVSCGVSSSEVKCEPEEISRSPSPTCYDQEESYTHITLINGEQICLRDQNENDFCDNSQDSMDLNSVLQAGVLERVAPASPGVSSTSNFDLNDLDWDFEVDDEQPSQSVSTVITVESPILSSYRPVIKPRATIFASQLPLPIPASSRLLDKRTLTASLAEKKQMNTVVISSSNLVPDSANNNNSLLRSALTSKSGSLVIPQDQLNQTKQSEIPRTLLATVKTEGERQVDDILLLSLEGREAVARLKDGASQLFPNTRVTSEPTKEAPNVISIEVDVSGNLVLHKSSSSMISPEPRTKHLSHLAKVRKYHRRSKEEPKKESRLLHYCHICNKGFKDKYSVNVHVRTHTGEKPFSCQLCGKCFRQKAHLAKHQQTHASKQGGTETLSSSSSMIQISNNEDNSNV